ncbi:MAG: vanadium-dependent haloperoxidase [Xanthomonadaceae bacterium]|nr:vanadium-dependent haloperoxidase [Xanthomonadaceae bacterium]
MLDAVRDQNIGTGGAGRLYAMTTIAMYDAVNGMDRRTPEVLQPNRGHALVPPDGAPNPLLANRGLAAAVAAYTVLSELVPEQSAKLDQALMQEIANSKLPGIRLWRSLLWGGFVGNQVLSVRANDGSQGAEILSASSDAGRFRNDWDGQLRNMLPFGISDPSEFISPDGPPARTSNEYALAVYRSVLFGAPDGNPEHDALAQFWRFPSNSVRETGGWFPAALEVARQQGTTASVSDTARLFALLGMAIADSVIVVWNEKALHLTWRPVTAIRRANEDGNPLTDAFWDPDFVSRFGQVGGSPEWTSGQANFAGAGAGVLSGFYCRDDIAFSFNAGNTAEPRSYTSFSEARREAVFSRILQGNHFEFTLNRSEQTGSAMANEIIRSRLTRMNPIPGVSEACSQF